MAEAKNDRGRVLSAYLREEALGVEGPARMVVFNVPGQDFKSVLLEIGKGDSKVSVNGLARLHSDENVNVINIQMVSRAQGDETYSASKGAPFYEASLFTQNRKEEGKASFLSGRFYTEDEVKKISETYASEGKEAANKLRQEIGKELTANFEYGHEAMGGKPNVKEEKLAAPAPGK